MTTKRAAPGLAGGFSLLELLVTLTIAGALLSFALPAFADMLMNERRTTAANDVLAAVFVARHEAVKRGKALIVCGLKDANRDGRLDGRELQTCSGHDWSDGWTVGAWDDANNDNAVTPGELTPIRVFQAGRGVAVRAGNFSITTASPQGTVVVRAFGRRSSNGTITVCDRRGPKQARAVIISAMAKARVSNRRADGSLPSCP